MQEAYKNRLVLNLEFCRNMCLRNEVSLLWRYSVLVYLTRGLGFANKEELLKKTSEFTGLSISAVRKWMPSLHHFTSKNKKFIHIKSKSKVIKLYNIDPSRASILCFENNLRSYSEFKKLIIVQLGLTLQRRFTYAWENMAKFSHNRSSECKSGLIDHSDNVPTSKEDVGVSLSKLSDFSGIPESTVSNYIKSVSERKIKVIDKLYYSKFKRRYTKEFFKENPIYGYYNPNYPNSNTFNINKVLFKDKGDIYVYRKISSRITSPNQTKKRNNRHA